MIVYKGRGMMKYALTSLKHDMTLHIMTIYGSIELNNKYKALLNKAKFQKGCIHFKIEDEMPLDIVRKLLEEASSIDLLKMKET